MSSLSVCPLYCKAMHCSLSHFITLLDIASGIRPWRNHSAIKVSYFRYMYIYYNERPSYLHILILHDALLLLLSTMFACILQANDFILSGIVSALTLYIHSPSPFVQPLNNPGEID